MYNPTGCASLNDGGCPCPEGEVKCYTNAQHQQARSEFFSEPWYGICTPICCEEGEETCYDEKRDPSSCALALVTYDIKAMMKCTTQLDVLH